MRLMILCAPQARVESIVIPQRERAVGEVLPAPALQSHKQCKIERNPISSTDDGFGDVFCRGDAPRDNEGDGIAQLGLKQPQMDFPEGVFDVPHLGAPVRVGHQMDDAHAQARELFCERVVALAAHGDDGPGIEFANLLQGIFESLVVFELEKLRLGDEFRVSLNLRGMQKRRDSCGEG
jgi:hypothetical protein